MSNTYRPPNEIVTRPQIAVATYRLHLSRALTFSDARDVVPYLADLGITDCYDSPLFQAGPESTHGYDVCGFEQFSPALGGSEGFDHLAEGLRAAGLGLLLDMVPNHMGNDLSNRWWVDVLEHGQASSFAPFFDINW